MPLEYISLLKGVKGVRSIKLGRALCSSIINQFIPSGQAAIKRYAIIGLIVIESVAINNDRYKVSDCYKTI